MEIFIQHQCEAEIVDYFQKDYVQGQDLHFNEAPPSSNNHPEWPAID